MASSITGMYFKDSGNGDIQCNVYKGISINKDFTITNKSTGAAIDVSGWSGQFLVKSKLTGGTTILDLTSANGGITIGTTDGKIGIRRTAANMAALTALQTGIYAFTLTKASGEKWLVRSGGFKVLQELPE